MKNKDYFVCLSLLFFVIFIISGCTSDKPYEQPSKIESTLTQTPSETTTNSPTPPTEPEKPKVEIFKIGESASDNRLKVTVNSFSFKDKITFSSSTNIGGQDYDSSLDFKPKEDYQFLILDLSIENLQTDKTSSISSIIQFKVSDAEGYNYDYSINTVYLEKSFEDGDILPNMKKRGNIAFEVPKNPVDLKFAFLFDIAGQTAIFDIK